MTIWVDADACPGAVKDILFRASGRHGVDLVLVANSHMRVPAEEHISLIQVAAGADVADDYIAEVCGAGDLVITADIPLAARIVEKGATGLDPRGEEYTENNVSSRLSMRDFMAELRGAGLVQGGPASLGGGDTQRFANALDRIVVRRLRAQKLSGHRQTARARF